MTEGRFCFDRFELDCPNRLLLADSMPVELSGRYLDALALLVRDAGGLVSKDRFMKEVWRGVPVTDEALTQCVKTLRRALGDDAARPRFIETVPKHGYRFVAAVVQSPSPSGEGSAAGLSPGQTQKPRWVGPVGKHNVGLTSPTPTQWSLSDQSGGLVPPLLKGRGLAFLQLAGAGVVGGGLAGLLGGIIYGFIGASQSGAGGASIVLVLAAISVLVGMAGAAGVSLGIAAAMAHGRDWQWHVAGGALGGLVVGAIVKLLGLDAFDLLLGISPGNVTGAFEGAALGGAVGLAAWRCERVGRAAFVGLVTGMAITALGGRLLGGSLEMLARVFPQSRLRLDPIGALFGEDGFGAISQIVTGGIEGGLFAASIAAAMLLARRQIGIRPAF